MKRVSGKYWAWLGIVALVEAVVLAVIPGKRGWFDVGVYYGTVHHWTAGGHIYDYVRPSSEYGFTYPPFAAICMLPMMLFTWHEAVAVSVILTVIASAALLTWLIDPIAQRHGWHRGFTFCIAAMLFAGLEPVRDTVSFGQVNLLLMGLVFLDFKLLGLRHRWTGVGIGLAAAIKLTPAIFIIYLVLTRRYREAITATGTAVAATMFAALAAPTQSLIFWTDAIWDTNRIGVLAYVSNQSLQGILARLAPPTPGTAFWALAAFGVLVVWVRKSRLVMGYAGEIGDDRAGFALTGVVACLISPITWVHHLVWLVPALIVLADAGRRNLRFTAMGMYVVLCSSLVWLWAVDFSGLDGFLLGNAYVWIGLAMLFLLPVRAPEPVQAPRPPRLALQTQITLPSLTRIPAELR